MMNIQSTKLLKLCIGLSLLGASCASPAVPSRRAPNSNLQASPASAEPPVAPDPQALCQQITNIKEMPFYADERGKDPIYNAFMDAGDTILPCLINKITDTTIMPDPRSVPRYAGIDNKVGDVAFIIFLRITKLDLLEFMPPEVKKEFKDDGVYAYLKHVKKKENRVILQKRLSEWYRQKYGREPDESLSRPK